MSMKTKLSIVIFLIFFMLSITYGSQPSVVNTQKKQEQEMTKPVAVEFTQPNELSIDSTALCVLDGKILPFNTLKEMFKNGNIEVIAPYLPKEAIPLYGEIARGGALNCITIKVSENVQK